MISEQILKKCTPDILLRMSPRELATVMLLEDPEYQAWKNGRGKELHHRIHELDMQIGQLVNEENQLEEEIDEYFVQSVQRLMPVAEQDLQEYLEEQIKEGIKEDFGHGQVSEKAGDH